MFPVGAYLPNRVRLFPVEEITTVADNEEAPEAGGLTAGIVEEIWSTVLDYYQMGLQPAMTLCIRRKGAVVLHRTLGHSRGNGPGDQRSETPERATPDTLFNMFSASKCVTGLLVHMLVDDGLLHLDESVARYYPEFGRNGKEAITIRHLLTHRAGIPVLPPDQVDLEVLSNPAQMLAFLCDATPISVPGEELAYHALTAGFVLAEVIARVSGKDVQTVLRERVADPLGLQHFRYGVEPANLSRVAQESYTGPRPLRLMARWLERSLGMGIQDVVGVANDPRFLTGVVPSGNVISTANEIGLFFEMLLRGGTLNGVTITSPRVIRAATTEQSYHEMDQMLYLPVRYGPGFMLGGNLLSFFGRGTPQAFGHLGFTNVLAYAEPERDISVAFVNNGKPFITPELLLWLRVIWLIAARVPRLEHRGSPFST